MNLTCIMPAFNEEILIEESVTKTISFWKKHNQYQFQLIVVNDGSSDKTSEILHSLKETFLNLEVIDQTNTGKGGAITKGVSHASSEGIIYLIDSDMPFTLEDQYRVVESVLSTYPVAYASRLKVSGLLQSNSIARAVASFGLTLLNRYLLGITIKDNQCGLKAFRGDLAKEIFSINDIRGWGFDLFVSSLLEKYKIKIAIVPVTLLEELRESRVNIIETSLALLRNIFDIRTTLHQKKLSDTVVQKYSVTTLS